MKQSQTIGANLRRIRTLRGRSQPWLSRAIGMKGKNSWSYISRLEAGKILPRIDTLSRIAEALETTLEDLCA